MTTATAAAARLDEITRAWDQEAAERAVQVLRDVLTYGGPEDAPNAHRALDTVEDALRGRS